jgi:Zn finger protein HypA/HybF involved in hydrogenase expression
MGGGVLLLWMHGNQKNYIALIVVHYGQKSRYMNKNIAKFKCSSCQTEWRSAAGPSQCSSCGSLYLDWLNYKELFIDKSKNVKN